MATAVGVCLYRLVLSIRTNYEETIFNWNCRRRAVRRSVSGSLVVAGHRGTDDPTMAALPFMAAKAAKGLGHTVSLWLFNEAVMLVKKGVAENVLPVGLPPLKEALTEIVNGGVTIYVCDKCAVARGIGEFELVGKAKLGDMKEYVSQIMAADKSINF